METKQSPLDRDRRWSPTELQVIEVLKGVYDPEIPVDIWDLGLIYQVEVNAEGDAFVRMTLTAPNCPVADSLPQEVEQKVSAVPDVRRAEVQLTFDPPYHPDFMTDEAKVMLGFL